MSMILYSWESIRHLKYFNFVEGFEVVLHNSSVYFPKLEHEGHASCILFLIPLQTLMSKRRGSHV